MARNTLNAEQRYRIMGAILSLHNGFTAKTLAVFSGQVARDCLEVMSNLSHGENSHIVFSGQELTDLGRSNLRFRVRSYLIEDLRERIIDEYTYLRNATTRMQKILGNITLAKINIQKARNSEGEQRNELLAIIRNELNSAVTDLDVFYVVDGEMTEEGKGPKAEIDQLKEELSRF